MTYYHGIGAVPGSVIRPGGIAPLQKRAPVFIGGPRVQVGPFNFGAKGSTVHLTQAWFGSREGAATQKWVGLHLAKFGKTCNLPNLTNNAFFDQFFTCAKSWKGWSINKNLPIAIWKGDYPLVKTQHPTTKEWWGIYIRFTTGKMSVTFKKVPRSTFGAIWDAITTVVSFIIDTVSALLDLFKLAACAIAQQNLNQLSLFASGKATLSAADIAKYKKMGLTEAQINKLKTAPTSSNTALVGKIVSTAVCGPGANPAVGALEEGIPTWVWILATAGGVGALGLWALKKAKL